MPGLVSSARGQAVPSGRGLRLGHLGGTSGPHPSQLSRGTWASLYPERTSKAWVDQPVGNDAFCFLADAGMHQRAGKLVSVVQPAAVRPDARPRPRSLAVQPGVR